MNGTDIKKAREAAGINQTDLSLKLGLTSRHTLADIENNIIALTDANYLYIVGIIVGIEKVKSGKTLEQVVS